MKDNERKSENNNKKIKNFRFSRKSSKEVQKKKEVIFEIMQNIRLKFYFHSLILVLLNFDDFVTKISHFRVTITS